MDFNIELTDSKRLFMVRVMKRKNRSLAFSLLSVMIAAFFLIYHGLIMQDFNALRFVIAILLLLSGRSHLKQYRSAVIFNKLQPWFNSSHTKVTRLNKLILLRNIGLSNNFPPTLVSGLTTYQGIE